MLSVPAAEKLIEELKTREISLGRNPATWYTYENHVYGVATVAKKIAERLNTGINPEEIYKAALLHDICRTEEDRKQRFHGILGYEKLIDKDEVAACSALLHMFPWNKLPPYEQCSVLFFGVKKDYDFVAAYLKQHQSTDFDFIIQLSDMLANKDGIVTLEQRWAEYVQRHQDADPQGLEAYISLKAYFDEKIGADIYTLFKELA